MEEKIAAPYSALYMSPDANLSDLSITNALKTLPISVKKEWKLNDFSVRDREGVISYVQPLLELLGVTDHRLTFHLKGKDAHTQAAIDEGVSKGLIADTISLSVLAAGLYANEGYVVGATIVTWRCEDDWLHDAWMNVSYCEYSPDEWISLHLSDCFDLSALRSRFPNARISGDGSARRLILSDNPADMPMLTRVEVAFLPTIVVENTTSGNRGGQVRVETGDMLAVALAVGGVCLAALILLAIVRRKRSR